MAKVTIQDVARIAGVSVATVDRVLNRRPGVRAVTVGKSKRRSANSDRIAARLARVREYRTTSGVLYTINPQNLTCLSWANMVWD